MNAKQFLSLVLGVLFFAILAVVFPNTIKNEEVKIPAETRILVIPKMENADSAVIYSAQGKRLHKVGRLFFLSNHAMYCTIPQLYKKALILRIYNIKTFTSHWGTSPIVFKDYFHFFREYDHQLFMQFLVLGGLTFLFVFSLIMGFITKIRMLVIFNFVSGFALFIAVLRYLPVIKFFSVFMSLSSIAVWVLWLLVMIFVQSFRFYATFNPDRNTSFLLKGTWILGIFVYLSLQLFVIDSQVLAWVQIGIIMTILIYWIYKAFKFVHDYQPEFQLFLILGGFLFGLQWASYFYLGDFVFGFIMDGISVLYLMFLAFYISKQLLFELKLNLQMNEEVRSLELDMGVRQISLAENQRKQIVDELNLDVLPRVQKLMGLINAEDVHYEQIEFESHLTLKSLRNYSYSLYPPYIDQLSFSDILKRDFHKHVNTDSARINLDIDHSLRILHHRVFKLWAYRIFQEYLLQFDIFNITSVLNVTIKKITEETWVYEIYHEQSAKQQRPNYQRKSINLGVYMQFMNAHLEEIHHEPQVGWRLVSEFLFPDV